jgi:hypothetical protein
LNRTTVNNYYLSSHLAFLLPWKSIWQEELSAIIMVFVSIITHCKMMYEKQTAVSRYGPPGFVDTEDQEKGTWPFQAGGR